MAAHNKLKLVIQVDTAANASIKSVNKSFSGLEKEARVFREGRVQGIHGMTVSMKAVIVGNVIYDSAKRAFSGLKDSIVAAIQTQDPQAGGKSRLRNRRRTSGTFLARQAASSLLYSNRRGPSPNRIAIGAQTLGHA
jgi:hypothetical protein